MAIDLAQIKTDFANVVTDLPTTFKDKVEPTPNEFQAHKTMMSLSRQYAVFGVENEYRFTLVVDVEDFSDAGVDIPDIEDKLVVEDPSTGVETDFRVLNREFTRDGIRVKLHMGNEY